MTATARLPKSWEDLPAAAVQIEAVVQYDGSAGGMLALQDDEAQQHDQAAAAAAAAADESPTRRYSTLAESDSVDAIPPDVLERQVRTVLAAMSDLTSVKKFLSMGTVTSTILDQLAKAIGVDDVLIRLRKAEIMGFMKAIVEELDATDAGGTLEPRVSMPMYDMTAEPATKQRRSSTLAASDSVDAIPPDVLEREVRKVLSTSDLASVKKFLAMGTVTSTILDQLAKAVGVDDVLIRLRKAEIMGFMKAIIEEEEDEDEDEEDMRLSPMDPLLVDGEDADVEDKAAATPVRGSRRIARTQGVLLAADELMYGSPTPRSMKQDDDEESVSVLRSSPDEIRLGLMDELMDLLDEGDAADEAAARRQIRRTQGYLGVETLRL